MTSSLRMDPDYLIIGAQRAGTTSLDHYLKQHPAVASSWLVPKELHYFSYNFQKSSSWYRGHFPLRLAASWIERGSRVTPVTGESSPYYLFHPLSPERVAAALPQVKLLVLLRDPVHRAHSHHRMEVSYGFESLSFPDAIRQEPSRLAGEVERMLADPGYHSFNHQHYSYLSRGVYIDQVMRWLSFFPRDRVLILISERFFSDPASTMQRVFSFLGLPSHVSPSYARINASVVRTRMDATTQRSVAAYFRPHNQRLFEHLGMEFPWSA